MPGSPFLTGNWAPVTEETSGSDGLAATVKEGAVPGDLKGTFLRIGPNPPHPETLDPKAYHLFFGHGMVHAVELCGGSATYRRKFVRTPDLVAALSDGDDASSLVVEEPILAPGERTGLANTAMVFHAGRLLCLEEGSKPWELALPSLDTLGRFTYAGRLQHNFTAHPKVCPETGEMVFFGYGDHQVPGSDAFMHYSVAAPTGELLRTVPVNIRRTIMMHDMAITRNYSIILDFPLWSMSDPTKVEDRTCFGVTPRHATSDSEIRWFDAPGQYGYHVANAWERTDSRVIDVVAISALEFQFRSGNVSKLRLRQWSLDLESGKTLEESVLCDKPCEFPIVDPRCVGLPCRYVWASRLSVDWSEVLPIDGVLRYDFETRSTTELTLPEKRRGGEVQFVPRRFSDGTRGAEGDGYLLMLAFHPNSETSEMLIFDAATMGPQPLAVVALPLRVPYGFHALWVDDDARESSRSTSVPQKTQLARAEATSKL